MITPELNPSQKKAVEAPLRPLIIVAGAGTGKTRTLTNRLAHLVHMGANPGSICAITFTNKAAREMEHRVQQLTIDNNNDHQKSGSKTSRQWSNGAAPFIGTFHALGSRILRSEAATFGRTSDFVIFDDHDSFDAIKKIIKEKYGVQKRGTPAKEKVPAPSFFREAISSLKSGMKASRDFVESKEKFSHDVPDVFLRYEDMLRRHNAFDFDDLIEKVVALFRDHSSVLQKYTKRFSHILIDEYQDLNNAQYELVKFLARGAQSLSVVGDAAQTIYTWRGADINIFLNFERDWQGAERAILDLNYRSSGNIINAASSILQGAKTAHPLHLTRLIAKNPAGDKVHLFEASDEYDEALWIAQKISESRIMNQELWTKNAEKSSIIHNSKFVIPSVAVLYRTNAQSRAIEQALLELHIPYHIFGGTAFYERREIKDIVAALRYAGNSADEISRDRLTREFSQRAWNEIEPALLVAKGESPRTVIERFLEAADYISYIERTMTKPEERQENIAELIRFADRFTELTPFLEELVLLQATDTGMKHELGIRNYGAEQKEQKNSSLIHNSNFVIPPVQLMTVHLSKGLEFDRVFIAGVAEGLLPHIRSSRDPRALEEERRLLYVAMTRARHHLAISFYGLPSRFLSALEDDTMDFETSYGDLRPVRDLDDEERYISID